MTESVKAALLGIVQGLTEFLPVSSSGHLEIAKAALNFDFTADESVMMTIVLHAATALSTLVVFRKDVGDLLAGLLRWQWNEQTQFAIKIIISMIPAAMVGLFYEDVITSWFDGNLILVGSMLCVTGALLFLADHAQATETPVGYIQAAIIGVAQAIAILPGISRSGATISTSVLLGIDRMRAARFSFLMVIPLILGKMAKDILSGELAVVPDRLPHLGIGFVAAFVTGVLACRWMIKLVRNCKLWWFSVYCVITGIVAIVHSMRMS